MADIVKFETPKDRRFKEIEKEIEQIGDMATAKMLQESLKYRNGKDIPYEKRSQTTDEWLQSIGKMILLKKEKDELLT